MPPIRQRRAAGATPDHGGDEVMWAVIVAAGSGNRFGGPKQYETVGGKRLLDHCVDAARRAGCEVVVVVPAADADREGGVAGGVTRSESVRAGLAAVPAGATIICVHDAARPFTPDEVWTAALDAIRAGADGAVPGVAVTDTIKRVDRSGVVLGTLTRHELVAVQTPQAFRAGVLRAAHRGGPEATDDAALVEAVGGRVVVVAGHPDNRKITTPEDLRWARSRVAVG